MEKMPDGSIEKERSLEKAETFIKKLSKEWHKGVVPMETVQQLLSDCEITTDQDKEAFVETLSRTNVSEKESTDAFDAFNKAKECLGI